jgi:hypothetical protein
MGRCLCQATTVTGRPAAYPSYVDLDPLIDVARLRSLDAYVRERLEARVSAERPTSADLAFYTGPFVMNDDDATLPGSRMVYLSRSNEPDDYYDLDRCEKWQLSEDAYEFSELIEFIATLPFAATGRMLVIYDPFGRAVTPHRDHDSQDLCHEFVWFRTNKQKPFFMLDAETGDKRYVTSHSAWFDTVNQYHGADATGTLSWSIRVDGRFCDALRAVIPASARGRANAPALMPLALPTELLAP